MGSGCSSIRIGLFSAALYGRHHTAAFANGEYLVGLYLGKAFDLLCGRPLDLDKIYILGFSQTEVQPQIALGHNA